MEDNHNEAPSITQPEPLAGQFYFWTLEMTKIELCVIISPSCSVVSVSITQVLIVPDKWDRALQTKDFANPSAAMWC